MNTFVPRSWVPFTLLVLMLVTAGVGLKIQPGPQQKRTIANSGFVLESSIPTAFADWTLLPNAGGIVANPETQEILDRLYSQVLSRTYVNAKGYRIMLSIAYGEDQRGGLQAHRPEVCYPAQGFELISNEPVNVQTSFGAVPGRRLSTRMGTRVEPLTYWFNMGGKPIVGRLERRMEEMRLVLTGMAPDGLLFRVSSIDPISERAFGEQERFVSDLLAALPAPTRKKISGL